MPELPEVETIRRELSPLLIHQTFSEPILFYPPLVKTERKEFLSHLKGKKVLSLDRKGKYLILHLSQNKKLLFHLRMEGKLFIEKKENYQTKYTTLFLPFENSDSGLAFYDVRKFGCLYYLNEEELGPLAHVGEEPFTIQLKDLYLQYHKENKPIKSVLLNQSLMSGIGNIYADEVLFASKISPFYLANLLSKEQIATLLSNAKQILQESIDCKGSTVRTYQASEHVKGAFQSHLKVYDHQGEPCSCCHKVKIEKHFLEGRGTSYCPYCQKAGLNLAITGKIASGKSLASHYFEEEGFARFSADEEVHRLYQDKAFLKKLMTLFPEIFTKKKLDKNKITKFLETNSSFKRKYTTFIFRQVKESINRFIITHNGENKIFEIPLLFDAHMEQDFTYLIGIETTRQSEHLQERGEDESRKNFNALNSYDQNRNKLDYILHSDGAKEELHQQVIDLIQRITR